MSAKYVLSWEEFMDPHWDALPKPSVTSLVFSVVIAFALAVFGAVLTYAVDSGDKFVASLFLWMSLLLLLAALWDFKFRSAQRRATVLKELRSVYERHKGTEETFDFDEQKWVWQSEGIAQDVPWKALLYAAEWPEVVSLATQNASVIVPKRLIEEERLEALRRMALGSVQQPWRFRVNLWDYFFTEVQGLWRSYPCLMAVGHLAGVCFFGMTAYGMYDNAGPGVVWGWGLAWSFLLLTVTSQFWYLSLRYFTVHKDLRASWEIEFSSRGLRLQVPKAAVFHAWAALRKFRETGRAFLIYIAPKRYYIVPKRHLSTEQQRALQDLLQENLAGS